MEHSGYAGFPHLQNQNLYLSSENTQGHGTFQFGRCGGNQFPQGNYYPQYQNRPMVQNAANAWNSYPVCYVHQNGYPQGAVENRNNVSFGDYGQHHGVHQFPQGNCYPQYQNTPMVQNAVNAWNGNPEWYVHQNEYPQEAMENQNIFSTLQFGNYGLNHGVHQLPQGNYYPQYQNRPMVQNAANAWKGNPGCYVHQNEYSQGAMENQNIVSSDRHETDSSSIEYQLLSSYSAPNELEGNIHQQDRLHLINYLNYLHKEPMSGDRISECDANATDYGNSDVSLNISSDVNLGEHGPNVTTGDQTIGFDYISFKQRNERNAFAESVIIKPKYKIGCDNSDMFVKTSDCASPKKLCCPFCDTLYVKLARHLEDKHKNEPDVQRFLSFPKGSKQRRAIQDSLRKTGLTNWNKNKALNNGEMITSRRPNAKFSNEGPRFKTCPYCNGFYTRSSLRLHVNYKCPQKPIVNNEKKKGERVITALATSVEARYHENASNALKKVYMKFRDDALVRSLKFDWLITVYGNKLSAKYTKRKSPDMIRGRLRLIARFLRELKLIEPEVTDLATLYHPKYFDRAVEAIQAVARFDCDNNKYGAPATASSCVTAVKQIGAMLIAEYIRRRDQEKRFLTKDFLILMNTDIQNMISKTVNENQSKMKRRRVINLPSLADLKLLNQFIQSESKDCYDELSSSFDYEKWQYLSELTMISILIFNRKRVGDTEDITIEDFECKEFMNENTNQQLFTSLSNEAKEVAKRYSRMKVRGKLNRTVPVLLDQSMEKNLNLLISHRKEAGILPKNEFLFALRPTPIEDVVVVNAGIALKKFVKLSGVKNPATITGTSLRKQFATMCVTLKLNDADIADVADFMGHAELVHRNSYRQNTIDRQVVKMSQWLEAALGNTASSVIDDTERMANNDNRQKAVELLQLLEAALGDEESSDNINDVHSAVVENIRNPSKETMKSKRVCVRNRKNGVCVRNRKSVN